jgi:orotidine-5'-phosphate decarboxylase
VVDNALDRTILALDNMQSDDIEKQLQLVKGQIRFIKLGLEQYCRYGKKWVQELQAEYDFKLFLDLKFHDIPNTVSRAIESLEGLNVDMLTIHLSGGLEMIQAAHQAAHRSLPQAKILGVSFLTSLGPVDLKQIFNFDSPDLPARFENLFQLAHLGGIAGVVCSPLEAQMAKKVSRHLLTVCPGIRFIDETSSDQKRVADPAWALKNGVDYMVIGRSLTQARDPKKRLFELSAIYTT